MDRAYRDLLSLQRPAHADDAFSRRHPKMTPLNRAKLFAPFAALAGFEEAARSKEVPYVPRRALDADEAYALNALLNRICRLTRTGALARMHRVIARVEYFETCTDRNHEGYGVLGLYHTLTGTVRRVDPVKQLVLIGDRAIPFSDISGITDPAGRDFRIRPIQEDEHDDE